ncbi:MAG TPA: hypothetical protein VFY67_18570 [Pyrinomonadaceae bacterium]|nr:hypothetical protein [Pyrinomonadaceae bacterium]
MVLEAVPAGSMERALVQAVAAVLPAWEVSVAAAAVVVEVLVVVAAVAVVEVVVAAVAEGGNRLWNATKR